MSGIDDQAALWVARLSADTDEATRAAFKAWRDADSRHQGAFLRAEAAWTLLDRAQVMGHGSNDSTRLINTLRHGQGGGRTRRQVLTRVVLGGSIAASLAAAVGLGWVMKHRLSFSTQRGELRNVPLADHSVAAVNTDSQIAVAMTDRMRHVQLVKGEAWFEVAKNPDAPFVVSAGDVRVRAVGTAFSVRRRDKGVDVLVTEGVVEAWNVHDKARSMHLAVGYQAFVPYAGAALSAYHPEQIERQLAWRERKIILNNEPLDQAAAEFNRYNAQQIIVADPAIRGEKLVGGFSVDQPESFARAVRAALDVPVEIRGDRIIIGASHSG